MRRHFLNSPDIFSEQLVEHIKKKKKKPIEGCRLSLFLWSLGFAISQQCTLSWPSPVHLSHPSLTFLIHVQMCLAQVSTSSHFVSVLRVSFPVILALQWVQKKSWTWCFIVSSSLLSSYAPEWHQNTIFKAKVTQIVFTNKSPYTLPLTIPCFDLLCDLHQNRYGNFIFICLYVFLHCMSINIKKHKFYGPLAPEKATEI